MIMSVMLATGRAVLDPYLALKEAGLTSDMHYADLGCGALGHFVFPAAAMVGEGGRVYAVDILKKAIEQIESRSRIEQMGYVVAVWGDIEREGGVKVPKDTLDVVSINNLGRLLKRAAGPFHEAWRLLRPQGKLLVVDWKPSTGTFGPASTHRVTPAEIRPIAERNEFRFVKEFDAGKYHWGMVFSK